MDCELACVDGRVIALADATIPVSDPGLLRGDGVFEAIRLYGGRPYALEAHLERMQRSAAGLRLPLDVGVFRVEIATLLAAAEPADALLRIIATRGGRRILLIEALTARREPIALEPITYAPPRLLDGIKSLSYAANMLALTLAREQGADDALLVTPHGRVLECPTSSFFLVIDGEVWTAPLADHVLDSITRRIVLIATAVREQPIELAALARAQEAFVAASPYEVAPVHRIGERRYGAPGPRTVEIAAAVAAHIAAELG